MAETMQLMIDEGLAEVHAEAALPPCIGAEERASEFKQFEYFHLLRKTDPRKGEEIEDDYAGQGGQTVAAELVDMTVLTAPGEVKSMLDVIQALAMVEQV